MLNLTFVMTTMMTVMMMSRLDCSVGSFPANYHIGMRQRSWIHNSVTIDAMASNATLLDASTAAF